MANYVLPTYKASSFHCPYCHAYSVQKWDGGYSNFPELDGARCTFCNEVSFWHKGELIVPDATLAPPAHQDLPASLLDDYCEAASIANKSPRGAAALLRLALQKLMAELGESGRNIDADIKSLVSKGLPVKVQQSLDILRVVGNESVHPGTMNIKDDRETAIQLFTLINFIVEIQITQPKAIEDLYNSLPENKRNAIEARDKVES
ncbi:hypothetical protein COF44_22875 [Bacillus toyonensis]|uniref:DUF4145 domain-containing protein n=1 Tax=Bacillus toyonensis TaxID=155322 RepID=UPI000BFBC873|nr:DUF4145 domain-containing protein [Bacillus toyonensis]PHC97061.1 hypothetical protein COF44_22875 [Bacillus toyonensis]